LRFLFLLDLTGEVLKRFVSLGPNTAEKLFPPDETISITVEFVHTAVRKSDQRVSEQSTVWQANRELPFGGSLDVHDPSVPEQQAPCNWVEEVSAVRHHSRAHHSLGQAYDGTATISQNHCQTYLVSASLSPGSPLPTAPSSWGLPPLPRMEI
jgi:hypothetical protein